MKTMHIMNINIKTTNVTVSSDSNTEYVHNG